MNIKELFEVALEIHKGEYGGLDFKIRRIDEKTLVFDKVVQNLNKRCHESGIITSDPKYWSLTPSRRRKKIDNEFYISLMKYN
jgi:hypothetical protein